MSHLEPIGAGAGLVSPLLGSDQQLLNHDAAGHGGHHHQQQQQQQQQHQQQSQQLQQQSKQRNDRIDVSTIFAVYIGYPKKNIRLSKKASFFSTFWSSFLEILNI